MIFNRFLSDEGMDAITEWIFCHWPCALENKEFVADSSSYATRRSRTLLRERERTYRRLVGYRSKN